MSSCLGQSALALRSTCLTLLLAVMLPFSVCAASSDARPPNIVLILADDQGWTGTSVAMIAGQENSRSDFFQTPNLEALARRSMVFSDAYSAAPICLPSRYSIQFGISPAQLHKTKNRTKLTTLPFETKSIPQVLKSIDPRYDAAHFGKWHIFPAPEKLGYDASDGPTDNRNGGNNREDDSKFWVRPDPKEMFALTQRSLDFMEREVEQERPFFLQISHYAVHSGVEARQATLDRFSALSPGTVHTSAGYAAMVSDLDVAVGLVIDKIEELGIRDTTYIFYTSDNGGLIRANPRMNYPLQKGKSSLYEGGLRVPLMVAGPGVAAGSRCDVPVIGWDLLPTFAELAGGGPLPKRVEGGSLRALLENHCVGKVERPREGLFFYWKERGVAVIRLGDLKLRKNWRVRRSQRDGAELELYDLGDDLSESKNLAAGELRERATGLESRLLEWLSAVGAEKIKRTPFGARPALP